MYHSPAKIAHNLTLKKKLDIVIVSSYVVQVTAIQEKLEQMYDRHDGFNVDVEFIDGFQGCEQDLIILSTIRTNNRRIILSEKLLLVQNFLGTAYGFLGNERALTNNENVWRAIVLDCKSRKCFFNVDQDTKMPKTILDAIEKSDQFDYLLDANSVHFKNALWKEQ
ncbi:Helicase SEN1 [Glycine max]|nr:Helicase SEN1 [Glycine max]